MTRVFLVNICILKNTRYLNVKKCWLLIDKNISPDHYKVKSCPYKEHKVLFNGKPNIVRPKSFNLNENYKFLLLLSSLFKIRLTETRQS